MSDALANYSLLVYIKGDTLWDMLRATPQYAGNNDLVDIDCDRLDWFFRFMDTGEAHTAVHPLWRVLDVLESQESLTNAEKVSRSRLFHALTQLDLPSETLIELRITPEYDFGDDE